MRKIAFKISLMPPSLLETFGASSSVFSFFSAVQGRGFACTKRPLTGTEIRAAARLALFFRLLWYSVILRARISVDEHCAPLFHPISLNSVGCTKKQYQLDRNTTASSTFFGLLLFSPRVLKTGFSLATFWVSVWNALWILVLIWELCSGTRSRSSHRR